MPGGITLIENGTVTSPQGFTWPAQPLPASRPTPRTNSTSPSSTPKVPPLPLASSPRTSSGPRPSSSPEERVGDGMAHAVVVNSGIANACVGEPGYGDAQRMTAKTAEHLGINPQDVLICSTGIVGVELPMSLIESGIDRIQLDTDGGNRMARAILTTDPGPKEIGASFPLNGKTITIGGIAKGAGMIHPDMATMLSLITTDAEIAPDLLKQMLKEAADDSFNMMTIDGDTSTNDTVLLMANGAAGAGPILPDTEGAELFFQALSEVCVDLAKRIAREGEGATKLIEVTVEGAKTLPTGPQRRAHHLRLQPRQDRRSRQRPKLGPHNRGPWPQRSRHRGK